MTKQEYDQWESDGGMTHDMTDFDTSDFITHPFSNVFINHEAINESQDERRKGY